MLFWFCIIFCSFIALFLVVRSVGEERGDFSVGLSLAILSTFSVLLVGEGVVRVKDLIVDNQPFIQNLEEIEDPELGWKGKYFESAATDSGKKILFIGDSFTHGLDVPSEQMYFSVIGKNTNSQVFAYGGLGYGTLQELIITRKLIEKVKPDVVVLQLCSNDIINNSYELEKRSLIQRATMSRPYWIAGRIQTLYPGIFGSFEELLMKHSRLFQSIFINIYAILNSLSQNGYLTTVENEIVSMGTDLPTFRDALNRTDALIQMFRKETKDSKFVSFIVDPIEPNRNELKTIMNRIGVPIYEDGLKAFATAEKNGENIRLADGVHLNQMGNQVLGEALAHKIASQL